MSSWKSRSWGLAGRGWGGQVSSLLLLLLLQPLRGQRGRGPGSVHLSVQGNATLAPNPGIQDGGGERGLWGQPPYLPVFSTTSRFQRPEEEEILPHQGLRSSPVLQGKAGWASLVAQWLRVCLPVQGTRVRALVWEDPTCRGATRPVSHNY